MDNNDQDRAASGRRLFLSRENFDDYLVALNAKLRQDTVADRILSGELQHPLIAFQRNNLAQLQVLRVPFVPPAALLQDPVGPYLNWLRVLTDSLLRSPVPVPAVVGLQQLQEQQNVFRQGERHIYTLYDNCLDT